jgi:hypothetical protein
MQENRIRLISSILGQKLRQASALFSFPDGVTINRPTVFLEGNQRNFVDRMQICSELYDLLGYADFDARDKSWVDQSL